MKITHLLAGAAMLATMSAANAATIFGVDSSNNLVTIDSGNPAATLSSTAISGAATISALDFRPLNNVLYGLGSNKVVYTINTTTGAATAVSAPLAIAGTDFGFDFNPTVDRLRIVGDTNANYVFNPNDGTLTTATSVFYAAGDANEGVNPDVTASAYTSSVFGAAASTTQLYSIDTANDILTRQANSAGTLNTVGGLSVGLGPQTSFDILGSDAFALSGRDLYRVNLSTGALTALGRTQHSLFGIAVAPVPEPGTWAMMLLGFGAIGFAMRRNRFAPRVRNA